MEKEHRRAAACDAAMDRGAIALDHATLEAAKEIRKGAHKIRSREPTLLNRSLGVAG
jgi:hypothetical protein